MASKSAIAGWQSSHHVPSARRPAAAQGVAKVLLLVLAQISHVAAAPVKDFLGLLKEKDDTPKDADDASLWLYLTVAAVLVLLGGAFAGLTIA